MPQPLVKSRNPVRALWAGLAATAVAFVIVVASGSTTYMYVVSAQATQPELERLAVSTHYLDDALTTTARIAAVTGDTLAIARYAALEHELDSTLTRAAELAGRAEASMSATAIAQANNTLVDVEHRALASVRVGQRQEATRLLSSPTYLAAKRQYTQGLDELSDSLRAKQAERAREGDRRFFVTIALSALSLLLLGLSWIAVFRMVRQHLAERRRREEQLTFAILQAEQASESKSRFLEHMSHELRTPLGSVIGFTNVLLKNRDGVLRQGELQYLQRIQANGTHLLRLIDEILDLARLESGVTAMTPQPTDVGKLALDVARLLEGRMVGREGLALKVETPESPAIATVDPDRLKQILINLTANALKFTEEGSVTIRVRKVAQPRAVWLEVQDTGIGIPPDRLDAVFEPFEQAETTTSRRYGGTGLGLTISRGLCAAMECELTVESTLGVGTTFTVKLNDVPVLD